MQMGISMAVHQHCIFVFFWCYLNIGLSGSSCDFEHRITEGYRLNGFGFAYFPKVTIYRCAAQCVMHSMCASFNFDLVSKTCYLNHKSAVENAATLHPQTHFLYSDISVWPKKVAGPCSDHTCIKSRRCVVHRDTSKTCEKAVFTDVGTTLKTSYKFTLSATPWFQAFDRCERLGSSLLVVDDIQEKSFIDNIVTTIGKVNRNYWIGFRYFVNESSWLLGDGTAANFTDWGSSQPSISSENRCAAIKGYLGWNSRDCVTNSSFICETLHSKNKCIV